MRDALLSLPLAALRIPAETHTALAQVGLKHITDVIDRPRAPLAARFGIDFIRRIDQALGREDEPIMPRLPVPAYLAERRFAEPILLETHVLASIESLAQELAHLLERRGEGARELQAALFRADGKVHRITVGTAAPLRDPARIRALFVERLNVLSDECDPGFGFDVIRLSALATERCDPVETGFADANHAAELAHLIDRLGARFGLSRVRRAVMVDTHIPEFAVAAVPAAAACLAVPQTPLLPSPLWVGGGGRAMRKMSATSTTPLPNPPPQGGRERAECAAMSLHQDSLAPVRPIRLFDRPEPIEAVAEIPDGPPVQFTWRQVRHRVASAEGPERIAMTWWRDEDGRTLTRDYFRLESREGVRVWVYREGLYGRETPTPRWFLHGLFA
jgi:protein ImuB